MGPPRLDQRMNPPDGGDHILVLKLQLLARIGAGHVARGHAAGIGPGDGWQRPVGKRTPAPRLGNDQCCVAERDDDFAPLRIRCVAPKAGAFQPLIFLKRRH